MSIRIPLPTPTASTRQAARIPTGLPAARALMTAVHDPRGASLGGLANALGGVADGLHGQERALRKEQSTARISKTVSDVALFWTQEAQRMQDAAPAGAAGFTPQVLKAYDDYTQKILEDAPASDHAALSEAFTHHRSKIGTAALAFEAGKQRQNLIGQYSEGASADAARLALAPADYLQTRQLRLAALDASPLPADVKADLKGRAESQLAVAAGAAMTRAEPQGVLDAMSALAKGAQPSRGFEWLDQLDAAKRLQLQGQAQGEVDRQRNQADIAARKQEGAAAGALNAYVNQLKLGIPPRPEAMDQWSALVAGSEHEATFNRLQQGASQVQQLLAKPVAEKVQALQAMQTRLLTEGGNAQDALLMQVSEAALTANIKMQTESPLQWAAQFAGQAIEPLDVAMLASEEGAGQFAAIINRREHTIAALRQQNPGMPIAPALLQPQEAQQLVAAFEAGNASEAGQFLAALVQAAGVDNPARLDALFNQLEGAGAGDADDLVRMAEMAANDARITLKRKTFSTDVTQTNAQVTATALHGRDILRGNGNGKGKDGIKYLLPKDAEMMAAIQDAVGAAYGSSIPGDSGYLALAKDAQIIKYWYVGEAARQGKLHSGELDEGLLKQAIRAVVGEATDFNGTTVLMPRGMDEDTFTGAASLAIQTALANAGLSKDGRDADAYGLAGLGGGRYMVTLGDMPTGVTVHIDPNDPDLSAQAVRDASRQRRLRHAPRSIKGM